MKIDFVILWVDGSDTHWQMEFKQWASCCKGDKSVKRFRDWNNLQYLFRGFENFTPWVNKIHFVTWGHIPFWLNINHPKLNIIKHDDFLDKKDVPIFNSRAIEVNLHRIKGLSEHFVYFNDDMFILKPLKENRFFNNHLPCDMLAFTTVLLTHLAHVRVNDLLIINKHFSKKNILGKNLLKWFNIKYRSHLFKSLFLLPWPQITGFVDPHQPQPFLKSTFSEIWQKEYEILKKTSASKFKDDADVNQYLFRYWQLCKGNFYPVQFNDSDCIQIKDLKMAKEVSEIIQRRKFSLLCINDLLDEYDSNLLDEGKFIIKDSFEKIFPYKSEFEL